MKHTGLDPAKEKRFAECGSAAYVYQAVNDPTRVRVQCNRCKNRWCEACQGEKRRLIALNLRTKMPPLRTRFLTLTLRARREPLLQTIDRLYTGFAALRRQKRIKQSVKGGVAFLELQRGEGSGMWHVHLHCLFQGAYLDHKLLSLAWHKITGDSYIVDVREIARPEYAIGYVTKYASKAISARVYNDSDLLCEAVQVLGRRHTMFTFGTWRRLKLNEKPDDDTVWQCIGSLQMYATAAAAGDAPSIAILAALRKELPVDLPPALPDG